MLQIKHSKVQSVLPEQFSGCCSYFSHTNVSPLLNEVVVLRLLPDHMEPFISGQLCT